MQLAEVNMLISKAAAIVHLFHKSPLAAHDLQDHQTPPCLKLCPANQTRWGSTLNMLTCLYKNRRAVTTCLQAIHETLGRDKPPPHRGGMAPALCTHYIAEAISGSNSNHFITEQPNHQLDALHSTLSQMPP